MIIDHLHEFYCFLQGDAGGPLVCPDENGNGKLAAIISFSHNRCEEAGIFTKVSKYEDWITPRLDP